MPGLVLPTAFLGLNCRARGLHGSFSQSEGAPRTLRLISDSSEEKVSQTTSTRILSDDDDQGATVLSGVRRGSDPLWSRSRSEMADTSAGGAAGSETGKAPVAQRIDPARDKLSPAQLHFMRQVELSQWQKTLPQRRGRNILTGLSIGALVLAIYGYTFYSVSQERFLDDLDDKAKAARVKAPGTNSP